MGALKQKEIQTITRLQVFLHRILGYLNTVKNKISLRYTLSAITLIASPFLLYIFKLFTANHELVILGLNFDVSNYVNAQVFIWTLSQKLVPVIAIVGIFFMFPASKNEKFISMYWLVFPLFSIYLYQSMWIMFDTKGVDVYFTEFSVWAIIISSIFSLALFRKLLIQKEKAFDKKLASIQGVLQQLRDEEVFKLFSNLYSIDVATGGSDNGEEAIVLRDKINDYALDGMKNINTIFDLLDKQKKDLKEIRDDQASSQAEFVF